MNAPGLSVELRNLLGRSQEFLDAIMDPFEDLPLPGPNRISAAYGACGVAFSHAAAIQLLMFHVNNTAAMGVVRLQFEALVRANWIGFAASEGWVDELMRERKHGEREVDFPPIDHLLDQVAKNLKSNVATHLATLKSDAWDAMNSYTHGGQRQLAAYLGDGYDPAMLTEVLKTSNGLAWMTAKTVFGMVGNAEIGKALVNVYNNHVDCLHGAERIEGV